MPVLSLPPLHSRSLVGKNYIKKKKLNIESEYSPKGHDYEDSGIAYFYQKKKKGENMLNLVAHLTVQYICFQRSKNKTGGLWMEREYS